MTDDGLHFHAIIVASTGERFTRETNNRAELLAWIAQHARPGATLTEVGTVATGPAISGMIAAMEFGQRVLDSRTPGCDCDQQNNPDIACHAADCVWRRRRQP